MKNIIKLLGVINRYDFRLDLKIKLCTFCILLFLANVNANTPFISSYSLNELTFDIQNTTITGVVTSEDGIALPGVSVQVKGSSIGTITDFDGQYSIDVPNTSSSTLVFVYLGMNTQEIVVGNRSNINVTMTTDQTSLEEVVVVGYGSMKKKDIAGAISTVKTEDLVLSSSPSIGDVLRGKAAGLQITQTSGQPGGGLNIQIRGAASINASNQPLIVVDGFPIEDNFDQPDSGPYSSGSQSFLNSFNPNDIESISVLKDASATSIYGARAANGVILITTKKGKTGKPEVTYSTSFSYQDYNAENYDLLNLKEWSILRNEVAQETWEFNNGVFPYGDQTLEEAIADPAGGVPFSRFYSDEEINNIDNRNGTDWLDLVTRDGSVIQHNLSLRGGSENTKYFLSGNVFEQKGILKNSAFGRASMRFNLDQKINKFIKMGINFTKSTINNDNSQLGGDQFENSGLIRSSIQYGPHIPAIDINGNYPVNPESAPQPNPYSLLTLTDEGKIERSLTNVYTELRPIKGLVARLQVGFDQGNSSRSTFVPQTVLAAEINGSTGTIASQEKNDQLIDFTVTYTKTLNDAHNFNFLWGSSYQETNLKSVFSSSTGFITDGFLFNNLGAGEGGRIVGSSNLSEELISFFGRLNYNYKNRYILSSSIRRDGSSRFGANNKYAIFPSIAIGWNIAEEPFLSNINSKINTLKIRAGYGELGNQDISGSAFAAFGARAGYLSPNEGILTAVLPTQLANDDLKWETTKELNVGLDFGFLNNRISGSFEYFDKVIKDLLQFTNINSYHYIPISAANVGSTQSKGIELTLNTVNIDTKNFTWESTLTYSQYDDRWKKRAPDWKPLVYEKVDDPIRAQFSYLSDGIMQIGDVVPAQPDLIPGQIKIKDVNGFVRDNAGNPVTDENGFFLRTNAPDGVIDSADTVLLGSSDPDFIAGFSNTFTYKNLTLNVHFNGMFGRQIIDQTDLALGVSAEAVASNGQNVLSSVYDRWTPTNPSTTRPSSYYDSSIDGAGDFFYQDAWFIRCQNLSLSYTLPNKWLEKYITSASLRLDAQNLFVITPYKGVDPETTGSDPRLVGTSVPSTNLVAAYPTVKTYTVGIDIKF